MSDEKIQEEIILTPGAERLTECLDVLDTMLGTLEERLTKSGISTSYKGVCAQCEEVVHDKVCTAFGKTWHPHHFLCEMCGEELWQKTFYERDGKAYCEKDYKEAYGPKCEACKGAISDVSARMLYIFQKQFFKTNTFL